MGWGGRRGEVEEAGRAGAAGRARGRRCVCCRCAFKLRFGFECLSCCVWQGHACTGPEKVGAGRRGGGRGGGRRREEGGEGTGGRGEGEGEGSRGRGNRGGGEREERARVWAAVRPPAWFHTCVTPPPHSVHCRVRHPPTTRSTLLGPRRHPTLPATAGVPPLPPPPSTEV